MSSTASSTTSTLLSASLCYYLLLFATTTNRAAAQSSLCRTTCGDIPIRYPFSIDEGCGSLYYRNLLLCSSSGALHLRTPSGTYPVSNITYSDPHLVVSDPSMWTCGASTDFNPSSSPPFSLDTSTHLRLSPKNDYLFFNCSPDAVIIEPRPDFCDRFPDRCGSVCDSAGYLCRNLPGCPDVLRDGDVSCCTYSPMASESVRLMLRHCATYTSVYWREIGSSFPPYDQVPEYGIRIDFQIPVTTSCLRCQDVKRGGGGTCGFDTASKEFLCLCEQGNTTTSCEDADGQKGQEKSYSIIVGTIASVSVVGIATTTFLVWYWRKLKSNAVSCGVQTNENRFF